MPICAEALDLIKSFEGYMVRLNDGTDRVRAYQEPGDVPTIGWGTTFYPNRVRVQLSDPPITREYATECMDAELEVLDGPAIRNYITVPLHPLSEGALYSWCYNLGTGAFRASALRMVINARQWDRVPGEFAKWRMAAGRVLPGLVRRRSAEAAMFMKGVRLMQQGATAAPAPSVPAPAAPVAPPVVAPVAPPPAPVAPSFVGWLKSLFWR